jgi:hypothetical protein
MMCVNCVYIESAESSWCKGSAYIVWEYLESV